MPLTEYILAPSTRYDLGDNWRVLMVSDGVTTTLADDLEEWAGRKIVIALNAFEEPATVELTDARSREAATPPPLVPITVPPPYMVPAHFFAGGATFGDMVGA